MSKEEAFRDGFRMGRAVMAARNMLLFGDREMILFSLEKQLMGLIEEVSSVDDQKKAEWIDRVQRAVELILDGNYEEITELLEFKV